MHQDLEKQLRLAQRKLADHEDALLATERQKADWARKMDKVSRDLMSEREKSSELQTRAHQTETGAQKLQERLTKLNVESQVKDEEIALLRSRENKTIVEHVHVLEKAKNVTDRELAATKRERDELAVLVKSLDQHKARLISDIEDMAKQNDLFRKQVKTSSLSTEAAHPQLAAERKTNAELEKRIRELEKRLQHGVEVQKRLELAEKRNASLEKELKYEQAKRAPEVQTKSESRFSTSPSHTRLLQELQLNNEQLKHQMSEELRRGQFGPSAANENGLSDRPKKNTGKLLRRMAGLLLTLPQANGRPMLQGIERMVKSLQSMNPVSLGVTIRNPSNIETVRDEVKRLQTLAKESDKARLIAAQERAKAEGKLRQMQALVCVSTALKPTC